MKITSAVNMLLRKIEPSHFRHELS